jgi:hypothetical protein
MLVRPSYKSGDKLPEEVTGCLPHQSVALEFSAPVINDEVAAHVIFTPDLAGGRSDYDPWANRHGYSHLQSPHRAGAVYRVALPEKLKAHQRYAIKSDAVGVKDEFGRSLDEPLDMAFMTSHRLPRMVLNHHKAVLEKYVDTDIAVYVTNLDKLKIPHQVVTGDSYRRDPNYETVLEKVQDVAYATPLGLRKMLNDKSGVVTGYLDSEPKVRNYHPKRYEFFAQVTPFQVHVKLGHFNLNGRQFEPNDRIEVSASAKLHAGGPYTNAETRITARLKQQRFTTTVCRLSRKAPVTRSVIRPVFWSRILSRVRPRS